MTRWTGLVCGLGLLTSPIATSFSIPATPRQQTRLQAAHSADQSVSRADVLGAVGGGALFLAGFVPLVASAADEAPALVVDVGPVPASFDLSHDYYRDAGQMLQHMKYATFMNRDTLNYEGIAKSVKSEMTDFVSYYRRFNNVAGKPSFSTLYTAINVMAGHYASYGPKFPIPEKRRKRLMQEFTEIERNIRRGR